MIAEMGQRKKKLPTKKTGAKKTKRGWGKLVGMAGAGVGVGLVGLVGLARLNWHGRYYPGVRVAGVEVGGMGRSEGQAALAAAVDRYQPELGFNETRWEVPKEIIGWEVDEAAAAAYRVGRRWELADYLAVVTGKETTMVIPAQVEESALNAWVDELSSTVEIAPVWARVEISGGQVRVVNGSDGVIVDHAKLAKELAERASRLAEEAGEIPLRSVERYLSEDELDKLKAGGEAVMGDRLEISQDDTQIVVKQETLVGWLVDEGAIREYAQSLASQLDRAPQDAKFAWEGGRVEEFAPARDGITVEVEPTTRILMGALAKLAGESKSESVEVVVTRTPPEITTESVNDLGIVERIGRGESYYAHSIANRIYNVGLASSRVNGVLLAPGEEFSFNKFVGEVSAATGYKTAYVISGGRTVLGDGGGVCQVSTTLFRAAMDAGLPITERWAHAYRVGYYEQNAEPGLDATVYNPSKDFRFVNDTPGHILVQTINDPKNVHLIFEIYGTSDGRVSTVSKPVVSGISPPPPDIYEDDASLPEGTVKQVDWAAWGARASFDYTVERGGEEIFAKTYNSSYRPWANVYLRGTGE